MARYLFDTDAVFFPVELCRLYWESPDKRDIFGNLQTLCDDFYAVVDLEKEYVFATVTKEYELIPNHEAAELGFDLLAHLLHLPDSDSCYALQCWTTAKRSECEIDIVSDYDASLPLADEGWRPMVKVVNSYNKKRKLTFYLGICQVDAAGALQGAFLVSGLTLELNSTHNASITTLRNTLFDRVDCNPDMDVRKILKSFEAKLANLEALSLTQRNMLALCGKIFGIQVARTAGEASEDYTKALAIIKEHVPMKKGRGDARAFFTAMMAFASTCDKFTRRAQTAKSELLLGAWLDDFVKASSSSRFQLRKYIGR